MTIKVRRNFLNLKTRKILILGVLLTLVSNSNFACAENFSGHKEIKNEECKTSNESNVFNVNLHIGYKGKYDIEATKEGNTFELWDSNNSFIFNEGSGTLNITAVGDNVFNCPNNSIPGIVKIGDNNKIVNQGTAVISGQNNIFKNTYIDNGAPLGNISIKATDSNKFSSNYLITLSTGKNFNITAGENNSIEGVKIGIINLNNPDELAESINNNKEYIIDTIKKDNVDQGEAEKLYEELKSLFGHEENKIYAGNTNSIKGGIDGILTLLGDVKIEGKNNIIQGGSTGIVLVPNQYNHYIDSYDSLNDYKFNLEQSSVTKIISNNGCNIISGNENGVFVANYFDDSKYNANPNKILYPIANDPRIEIINNEGDNIIVSQNNGIYSGDSRYAFVKYDSWNTVHAGNLEIFIDMVKTKAKNNGYEFEINNLDDAYEYLIKELESKDIKPISVPGGKVILQSNTGKNIVLGKNIGMNAVNKSNVVLEGKDNYIGNNIQQAVDDGIIKENDLITDNKEEKYAVYAQNGSKVEITANDGVNTIISNSAKGAAIAAVGVYLNKDNPFNNETNESYVNSSVEINGSVNIENSKGTAILAAADSKSDNKESGIVNINLKETNNSSIIGNIVAKNDGKINISNGDVVVKGDITSTDNATVDLEIGNGALFGKIDNNNHTYKDELSQVNLKMGNAQWQVTGQSWINSISSLDGATGTIDLSQDNKATAVHINELNGIDNFVVNLNAKNVANGDMIYVQNVKANQQQNIIVSNEKELLKDLQNGERIRFATIGANSENKIAFGEKYTIKDRGINNVDMSIKYVGRSDEEEQKVDGEYKDIGSDVDYNGSNSADNKPGNDFAEEAYKGGQNVYLTKEEIIDNDDDELNDVAKTIINMSKANYKNAVYMDRLNKRLGEARYFDGTEGMWVRVRHDKIGEKNAFNSQNTMYQLGYDKLQENCTDGMRHIGAAFDYMRGNSDYQKIAGDGDTKRIGFWLYDTWLGEKGHYVDYVAKYGHLSNEFDIKSISHGEKITGEYANNVFSISAEYGRKKALHEQWYIEPQVQLQLARVTDAGYTSSQDTKVYVDAINSLIGRIGFRLGKDFDAKSSFYVKADLLHEFLGEQRISATDITGTLDRTYENKGTWYDVGLGFATAMGHDSYAYLDLEHSFGNDNDDTYQVNVGLQWNF